MLPSEYYVQSCTLFDDQYLVYQNLIEQKSASEIESKSQLNAGGYSYTINNDFRFIIWRINGNQLELIEQSLVYKLNENCKRITFNNSMIIPKVHIQKDFSDPSRPIIQILIATTFKLYRLSFKVQLNEFTTKSIFYNFSNSNLSNIDASNSYEITLQHVDSGNIFVNPKGEAIFAFILPNNSVSCVLMGPVNKSSLYDQNRQAINNPNLPTKFELNQPSIVKRLWSGISRNNQDSQSVIVSFKLFNLNNMTYLIALCKDLKIRVFCLKRNQCMFVEDLVRHVKQDNPIIWEESMLDIISFNDNAIFSVVLTSTNEFKVCNLKIEIPEDNSVRIDEVSKKIVRKKGKLVSIFMSNTKVWLMYKNDKESIEIVTITYDQNNMKLIYLEESHLKGIEKDRFFSKQNDELIDDEEEDELFNLNSKTDIIEQYFKHIFEPYKFSKTDIFKALGVLTNSPFNDQSLPKNIDELKKIIVQSIEKEVQNHPNFGNVTEEEFLYLNSKCWLKFFTILKQYDYDSRIPVGMFIDPTNESLITLIRKNAISVYNFADISQYNSHSQTESIKTYLNNHNIFCDNDYQSTDLLQIVTCIQDLSSNVKILELSNTDLNRNPDSADIQLSNFHTINALTDSLVFTNKNFLTDVYSHLNKISSPKNILRTLQLIIDILDCDINETDIELDQSENMDVELNMESSQYLRSEFTVNFVLSSFYNRVSNRYQFLKSLSILINIIRRCYENLDIPREISEEINVKCCEKFISYLNGYEYLKWLHSIYLSYVTKQELDKNARRVMDLIDCNNSEENLIEMKQVAKYENILMKSFILSSRNKRIFDINNIVNSNRDLTKFNDIFDYLMLNYFRITWPLNKDETFGLIKFLLLNGQYIHLNSYCLATKWIQKGKSLRYFLLGNSCLFFNEIDQSIDLFLKASHFINSDQMLKIFMRLTETTNSIPAKSPFINKRKSINITKQTTAFNQSQMDSTIFNNTSNIEIFDKLLGNHDICNENQNEMGVSADTMLLSYYIKIIHYYDLNGEIEAAIELVHNALLKFQFDAKSKSTLYCILFKSYMSLEYYEKAHASIVSNMDLEWKLICLKHLISDLCNQNKASQLISFDYGDLHQDVLKILYERANRSDLRTHDFYNIIFSLHLKDKDYLKAAYCMIECATRLKIEVSGLQSLKRQEKCYLACLNVLKLVDKKYAWVTRPIIETTNSLSNEKSSTKNSHTDENSNMTIIDIDEINRNYMAINYMIKLSSINQNQSNTANFYNTDEIISLLIKHGLFDDALIASSLFKTSANPMTSVFVGLVDKCCQERNDLLQSDFDFSKNCDSIECYLPYENPTDFKWRLLISYLTKYNNTEYYKIVCKRLLKKGFVIPESIGYLFKQLNPNALLRIYIEFNLLEEGIQIISEQIDQIINKEHQSFSNEQNWINSSKLSTLSFTNIDKILYVLNKSNNNSENAVDLKKKLSDYLIQTKFASETIIKNST